MNNRKIIQNALITPDGTILNSIHRHDYVCHVDLNGETYMTDGGSEYTRRSLNVIPYTDLTLYEDDPFEYIRHRLLRGTFGKNSEFPLNYVKLKDLSDQHLEGVIDYEEKLRPDNPYLKYYREEKLWRKK